MIEFENDTAMASSNAHTVVVRDTLDGAVFDLASFAAKSFSIGTMVEPLNGGQSFTRTVDMRPEIDVLAQVRLDYSIDTTFAVATWTFSSLDPMTLQPATADTLGFLAIGGTGDVSFNINRVDNLRQRRANGDINVDKRGGQPAPRQHCRQCGLHRWRGLYLCLRHRQPLRGMAIQCLW